MIVVVCGQESRRVGIDEDEGNYGLAGCWSWRDEERGLVISPSDVGVGGRLEGNVG